MYAILSTDVISKLDRIPIKLDTWYHVMVTVHNGMTVYINNKQQAITTTPNKDKALSNVEKANFVLGEFPNVPTSNKAFSKANIGMDNLAVWTKRLSRDQLSRIYSAELGRLNDTFAQVMKLLFETIDKALCG